MLTRKLVQHGGNRRSDVLADGRAGRRLRKNHTTQQAPLATLDAHRLARRFRLLFRRSSSNTERGRAAENTIDTRTSAHTHTAACMRPALRLATTGSYGGEPVPAPALRVVRGTYSILAHIKESSLRRKWTRRAAVGGGVDHGHTMRTNSRSGVASRREATAAAGPAEYACGCVCVSDRGRRQSAGMPDTRVPTKRGKTQIEAIASSQPVGQPAATAAAAHSGPPEQLRRGAAVAQWVAACPMSRRNPSREGASIMVQS